MIVVLNLVLIAFALVVLAKTASIAHGVVFIVRQGGDGVSICRVRYAEGKPVDWKAIEQEDLQHLPLFHRQEDWLNDHPGRFKRLALRAFWRAYYVVPILSVVTLIAGSWSEMGPGALFAGLAAASAASVMAINAVVRRLVLGWFDVVHWDLRLPPFTRDWAIQKEAGSNRSVFFLLVSVLVVLGFAALFCGIDAVDGGAFLATAGASHTSFAWIYFSLITLATVGLGDVQPHSLAGQIAVSGEVLCGPVLLAWLIAMYLSSPGGAGAGPQYP